MSNQPTDIQEAARKLAELIRRQPSDQEVKVYWQELQSPDQGWPDRFQEAHPGFLHGFTRLQAMLMSMATSAQPNPAGGAETDEQLMELQHELQEAEGHSLGDKLYYMRAGSEMFFDQTLDPDGPFLQRLVPIQTSLEYTVNSLRETYGRAPTNEEIRRFLNAGYPLGGIRFPSVSDKEQMSRYSLRESLRREPKPSEVRAHITSLEQQFGTNYLDA
jgi:hypothetical protein